MAFWPQSYDNTRHTAKTGVLGGRGGWVGSPSFIYSNLTTNWWFVVISIMIRRLFCRCHKEQRISNVHIHLLRMVKDLYCLVHCRHLIARMVSSVLAILLTCPDLWRLLPAYILLAILAMLRVAFYLNVQPILTSLLCKAWHYHYKWLGFPSAQAPSPFSELSFECAWDNWK